MVMMFSKGIASIVTGIVAIGLVAAAVGSGAWQMTNFIFVKGSIGLFQHCSGGSCKHMTPSEDYQKVAAAFLLLALLCLAGAVFAGIYAIRNLQLSMFRTVFILYLISALFVMVGCACYAGMVLKRNRNAEFGWGFIIGWVGMVVSLAASIVAYKAL